jgi:hypothetical protein
MKNIKFGTAVTSLLGLLLSLTIAASPAAGQSQPDSKRLDAPVSVPAPAPGNKPVPAAAVTKEALLREADAAYYIPQNLGLKSFKCTIQPNWAKFISDRAQLSLVQGVEYSAAIDDQGAATVTAFRTDEAAIDPSVNQIVDGVKQTIEGFFQTWNNMVLSGLFSPATDGSFVFSTDMTGYHLSQKTADTDSELTLTKDALIIAMRVITGGSTVVMQPKYTKTDQGLLLIALNSDITTGDSSEKVNFQIQYQLVEGIEMPALVAYQVTLPAQTISIEINLGDYQIVKN